MTNFDLILLYYDNPKILHNWMYRLFNFTDYLKYKDRSNIIIADSGTPKEKRQATVEVLKSFSDIKKCIYAVADTEEIRKKVPDNVDARPASHAYNMAVLDISKADIIFTSVIGHLFSPRYFERILAIHILEDDAVVLPKRFDLECSDYHEKYYDKAWVELQKFQWLPSGGWPDMSVRRKWLVEIGGYDENYITIAPVDMDCGARLTSKLDQGSGAEFLFPEKGKYNSLGLTFIQPFYRNEVFSLTCNTYGNHTPKDSPRRQLGYQAGERYYLENWGIIERNKNRIPIKYEIIDY